jgi:hypothetical protein
VRENHSAKELDMPMKRYKPEQIVTLLRQIAIVAAEPMTTPTGFARELSTRADSWKATLDAPLI